MNQARQAYGLPSLGRDLRRVYTDADFTLYADIPGLVPLCNQPDNHAYLGPIIWSPEVDLRLWWHTLPDDRPLVYVTLGSSGRSSVLEPTLDALADLHLTAMVATAGRIQPGRLPANVRLAGYLPGEDAARRASLMICNGGSPTTSQALIHGRPVLGIPSNMDQYLNMQGICRAGAGRVVRSDQATTATLRAAVQSLRSDPRYTENAQRLAQTCQEFPATQRFEALLARIVNPIRQPIDLISC